MKKIAFPRRRRHGTIRTRLIVSFSVPVLAVMLLVMIGVYRILLSGSEAQVLSFARSSYDQSYELVSSYIEMMLYASDSIYYNGDLQRIRNQQAFLTGLVDEIIAADTLGNPAKVAGIVRDFSPYMTVDDKLDASRIAGLAF